MAGRRYIIIQSNQDKYFILAHKNNINLYKWGSQIIMLLHWDEFV